MKKFLLILLTIFLTNVSALAIDYSSYYTQRNGVNTPSGCPECRRVRKRFAKPLTRFAQPRPRQKTGYYKTKMNTRYQKPIRKTTIQASRFNKNYAIVQAEKTSCNGITFYGANNICE